MIDILTGEELHEWTQKSYRSSQKKQLEAWGIPFRVRLDGSLVVERRCVRADNDDEIVDSKQEPQLILD